MNSARLDSNAPADAEMFQPDLEVLQEICDTIAARVPCDISIMACGGEVVASSISGRQGKIHEGARRILNNEIDALEVTAQMAAQSKVMLEGCNLPVQLAGQRIVNVGIAAPLAEARNYAAIVQTCIQVMLREHLSSWRHQQTLVKRIKDATHALSESEQRLKEVTDYMFDSVWETGPDHRYTFISAKLSERLELNAKEIIGRTRWACMEPYLVDPAPRHWQAHRDDLDAHRNFKDFYYAIKVPSGNIKHLLVSGIARFDTQGTFLGYRGAARDVSAQIEAEQALKESEARLGNIIASSSDWIWTMDEQLRFSFLSDRFYQIFKIPRGALIGHSRRDFVGPELIAEDPEKWRAHFDDLEHHRSFKEFEYSGRKGNGERFWIKISGAPYFRADGSFAGYQGTGTDHTALKQAQNQLIRNEKLTALSGLVAGVAHEINTPIGNAITATSSLIHECEEIEQQLAQGSLTRSQLTELLSSGQEISKLVLANLKKGAGLIDSLKAVVTENSDDQQRRFNLHDYLQETVASLQPELDAQGVQLKLDCPTELTLYSVPGAFYQILNQLITNSLRHGFNRSGGRITIQVSAGNPVRIDYQDNGQGMRDDDLTRLFEPFYTTTRGAGSTGLGMFLVHNLVTQTLGGAIQVESLPGKGVCFTLDLPQQQC